MRHDMRKRQSDSPRSKSQQKGRRKLGIFKKVYEYSLECNGDVLVMLRIRETGKLSIFSSGSISHLPLTEESSWYVL
jgi:hypothetical protein